jgi:hypothetical protein
MARTNPIVQIPHRVPVFVGHLLEACMDGESGVVDEHVQAAERVHRRVDGAPAPASERSSRMCRPPRSPERRSAAGGDAAA